ncbi:hypothetical protein MP638_002595 [Amoeboaphelidium occidentale]|nr:hypothetical protein MP638_002595 [Amoeboaphelidium occidentale]
MSLPVKVVWSMDPEVNSGVFNPSILHMPDTSPYQFFAVGRMKGVYKYKDPDWLEADIVQAGILGCFMNLVAVEDYYEFHCVHEPRIFEYEPAPRDILLAKVDAHLKDVEHRDVGYYSLNQGPEDGRIFWNYDGGILMVYGMNSFLPGKHRTPFLTDARNFFPELREIWNGSGIPEPAWLFDQNELGIQTEELNSIEKNWSPLVTSDKLYLQAKVQNRLLYEIGIDSESQATLAKADVDKTALVDCMNTLFNDISNKNKQEVHQASNLLRLKLCYTRNCDKAEKVEEIYFQVIHVKSFNTWLYKRYVALWSSDEDGGFKFLKVKGPMSFPGASEDQHPFITTISYIKPSGYFSKDGKFSNVAYLDTPVVVSFGVSDNSSGAFFTTAEELITGARGCE